MGEPKGFLTHFTIFYRPPADFEIRWKHSEKTGSVSAPSASTPGLRAIISAIQPQRASQLSQTTDARRTVPPGHTDAVLHRGASSEEAQNLWEIHNTHFGLT